MREVDMNKKVAQWISKYGWAHKRIANPGRAGEPDVTGSILGFRIELEGKLPGQKPTKLQFAKLRKWEEAGAITGWYTSIEEAQAIVIDGLENKLLAMPELKIRLDTFLDNFRDIKQK